MPVQQQSLNEAYRTIKELIERHDWQDAHRACLEVLRFDPENIRIIRFKNKIEAEVRKLNKEAIKADLKNLKQLFKAKNFPVLMESLRRLEPFINDFPPLKQFMLKVQKAYEIYTAKIQESLYIKEIAHIKDMVAGGNFQEALRQGEKLRLLNLHEKEVKALVQKIKSTWVDQEISKSQALLQSDKYEDIILFYQNLLRIDGRSEKLKKLIENFKKKAQIQKIEEKRDFIYSSMEKIRTLYQLHKYESAMMASIEILNIEPENAQAKHFYNKTRVKVRKIINKEVINQMVTSAQKMKEDFKINRQNYIRL